MPSRTRALDVLTDAVDHETRKAEDAFVRAHTAKATNNCKHAGQVIGDALRACTIRACGVTELESVCCHDRKATTCTLFVPATPPETARRLFRSQTEQELIAAWPTLGKLLRMLRRARAEDLD
jgi:hypothetical protein